MQEDGQYPNPSAQSTHQKLPPRAHLCPLRPKGPTEGGRVRGECVLGGRRREIRSKRQGVWAGTDRARTTWRMHPPRDDDCAVDVALTCAAPTEGRTGSTRRATGMTASRSRDSPCESSQLVLVTTAVACRHHVAIVVVIVETPRVPSRRHRGDDASSRASRHVVPSCALCVVML